ncbi:MAG TPA: hypothetical protein VLA48_00215 [Nitrososphaeraceae archaeon]|nr:hypothetical protein [Nitrososphaeraceae archaeon]
MFTTRALSSSSFNIITKVIRTIFLVLSLSIVTFAMIRNNDGDYESSFIVFAQMEKDKDTNQKMNLHTQSVVNNSNSNSNRSTTFSAIGTISSLVITVPEDEFNITNAFTVILTGDWILNVHNGTVTNFEANFLASPMDGSMGHIHQITNFSANEDEGGVIILSTSDNNSNNSLSINGTADIKINGITIWNDAEVSITISKGNTITIDPDDKDTGNHFGNQQVYGIVNRLIVM